MEKLFKFIKENKLGTGLSIIIIGVGGYLYWKSGRKEREEREEKEKKRDTSILIITGLLIFVTWFMVLNMKKEDKEDKEEFESVKSVEINGEKEKEKTEPDSKLNLNNDTRTFSLQRKAEHNENKLYSFV
jgi:hypothetical protein